MGIKSEYLFQLIEEKNNVLRFKLEKPYIETHISVLEQDIIKVTFLKNGKLTTKKTWAIAPNKEDIAFEGTDRLDISAFTCPKYTTKHNEHSIEIETTQLKLVVALNGFKITWFALQNGTWIEIAQDRKTQAYNFDYWGDDIFHYQQRSLDEQYFGFGEKAGKLNKHFRRMKMTNLDPMGYDAEWSDPLYKHTPFYITRNTKTGYSFGIFYDNFSETEFEMGTEIDNYHGLYRYYKAKAGDLDYYFIAGKRVKHITERFSWLTGKTIFSPKWSLGYSGSTMTYTDMPDAQNQMNNFLNDVKKHNIPCSSFQLSSGYTSIGDKRYVFNWNTQKFPDIKAFTKLYNDNGIKLCANIKPCFLKDHPHFNELQEKGFLIKERNSDSDKAECNSDKAECNSGKPECNSGKPELVQFWDDCGAYIDFTNKDAFEWWKDKVTKQLLEYGIDSTWNDNNEFEVWDNKALCNGFGQSTTIETLRPILTLLMMKASFEAQKAFAPNVRPYLISRSGCPGMQRYVQTWSGDNRTAWKTIRFNNYMAISLSLSGMYNLGHDVGGFAGEAPEPELFVRWVQNGIFYPRFTIHSWNDDKSVNVPWMYPEVFEYIKKAMFFRYKIIPYLYTIMYKAHTEYIPIIKPTFYDFDYDTNTFNENDEFMLGDSMLVASVMEKGQTKRTLYLPSQVSWYDYHTNALYDGGQTITVNGSIDTFPLMIKEGSVIPINEVEFSFEHKDADNRAFIVYAHKEKGESEYTLFEDDGISQEYLKGTCAQITVSVSTNEHDVVVCIKACGDKKFIQDVYTVQLVDAKKRQLIVKSL